jgi:signal transduction histidine kinase
VAFAAYGAALIGLLTFGRRSAHPPLAVPVTLAAVESLAALFMNVDTSRHLHGTGVGLGFLVIVAAQLPYFLGSAATWTWIVAQTALLIWLLGGVSNGAAIEMLTFAGAALGFQAFAAASSILALSEGRARTNLARANAELTATRELLAESSRTSERLRISRDLHDTLGHHLAALSLQLDVAARLSNGHAAEHVRQAHAITRLLLTDVRDVVSALRDDRRINFTEALRTLASQPMRAQVHLDMPDTLLVDEPARAEALLRAVQELLTNTARHADAAHLWIRLQSVDAGVTLVAPDDGQGTDAVAWGNGLTGMRERFEEYGGRVDVVSVRGNGFEVRAFMPLTRSA